MFSGAQASYAARVAAIARRAILFAWQAATRFARNDAHNAPFARHRSNMSQTSDIFAAREMLARGPAVVDKPKPRH